MCSAAPSASASGVLELAEALARGHEQRAEARHDEEPAGDGQLGGDAAGDRAQQEPHGQQGELDHRLVLEEQRVREREDRVREQDAEQADVHHQGEAERRRAPGRRAAAIAAPGDELARGDRPRPLGRVGAVGLDVAHVVDQVGRARHQAERDEGDEGRDQHVGLEQGPGGERRGEDEDVLQPLARTHRGDERGRGGPIADVGLTHRGPRAGPARSHRRCGRSAAPRGTT